MAKVKRQPVPRHLISTAPRESVCGKCHLPILFAMVHGEPVKLDRVHLSLRGEAMALIAGTATYIAGDTRDGEVRRRSVELISRGLPATARIHPGHRCGARWDDASCLDQRSTEAPVAYSGVSPPF